MRRVLLLATTTGYQTRAFEKAAERLGVELVYATDRCDVLDDPWQDHAIPIRFHDEAGAVEAIVAESRRSAIHGIVAVGDRPAVIAAHAAQALGLPGHPPSAAATARNKRLTRQALGRAGLPVPWVLPLSMVGNRVLIPPSVTFPCVVKPMALSGSRGVIRADDPTQLAAAVDRVTALLRSPDIRRERDAAHDGLIVEGFIPGCEFAVEGIMQQGLLHPLAVFGKPDPLDGPFFEETIYITPPNCERDTNDAILAAVERATHAIGLSHGPIHAECRVREDGTVFVLEVAARPIGGLCSRALRFIEVGATGNAVDHLREESVMLEAVILEHALGRSPAAWIREPRASGVMMIPIPRRGVLRGVSGVADARNTSGVQDVVITAKMEQLLVPLPEGASYLGFIFARGQTGEEVEAALRAAHRRLVFAIDPEMRVLQSHHG